MVAVVDLENLGVSKNTALNISNYLRTVIISTGKYILVNREDMNKILKEQGFQISGACDTSCAVEMGNILGAQKMFAGSLGKVGKSYIITIKYVNVESGETEAAKSIPNLTGEEQFFKAVDSIVAGIGGFKSTADYAAFLEDVDDMVLIPAGEFTMGNSDGKGDEKPSHNVYLDAYYIDKHEVTNAQYGKFMQATGREKPEHWDNPKHNQSNQPVVGVSWYDVVAYAEWAGKRLPTEAEWEKAARGTDGRKYPWGNSWDKKKCNATGKIDGYKYAAPAGSFESGKSPYGCYDMAGNVWEWVADWYGNNWYNKSSYKIPKGPATGKHKSLRGGSWYNGDSSARCADRYNLTPDYRRNNIGFRCARTP